MRLALLSDIHGNDEALRAALADVALLGLDDGLVLGDVAQGGEDPAAVLDRLRDLGWPVILGNADDWLLAVPEQTEEPLDDAFFARREWTLAQLEPRHLDQIRAFHRTYERGDLLAFHASPRHYEDVLLPETEDVSAWAAPGYAWLAGGHTHTQWARRIDGALYVNPGSVGRPYDHFEPPAAPRRFAQYAVLDGGSVEFRTCVY